MTSVAQQTTKVSLYRRFGRKYLRLLRPFLLPLLNRFQTRLHNAIENSSVPALLREMPERLSATFQDSRDAANTAATAIEAIRIEVAATREAVDRAATAVDAKLREFADANQREAGDWRLSAEDASVRIAGLQVALDAVRLDQLSLVDDLRVCARQVAAKNHASILLADTLRRVCLELSTSVSQMQADGGTLPSPLLALEERFRRMPLILGDDALVQTPEGFLLVPVEDRTLLSALWESGGRLEPGTILVLSSVLREGDYVIDVGAHIGLTALPAARKVGASGHVIAIEPGSRAANLFEQNMSLNFLSERVSLHRCAAGDTAGRARLHLSPIVGESSLLELSPSLETEDVEVWPIDSLVEPGRAIRLVKLDAEGYEPWVWRGMQRVIDDSADLVVLVEFGLSHLRRSEVSIADWYATFSAPGFTLYVVNEQSGGLKRVTSADALSIVTAVNLLLLRQPPEMFPELRFE